MGYCERDVELTDWVLGELPAEKAREVERHVTQCAECARSAERLRKLQQTLTSHLTDRDMPARLVFVGEPARAPFANFWGSLVRTAALSAAAAAVFLAILAFGSVSLKSRLLPAATPREAALTRAEIQDFVKQAVAEQAALERKQIEAGNAQLAASLRQEQAAGLSRVARQLDYVETAQNTVWKQMQQQNEYVSLIARNSLQPASLSKPPARR
ncbi:MAG: zf-HC2 domain-containing protein [Acidobacteriia bacterium]|nr:zf-HC2 domain-containing protein [Terriglobia bacterium]